jgi:hypothetical protein
MCNAAYIRNSAIDLPATSPAAPEIPLYHQSKQQHGTNSFLSSDKSNKNAGFPPFNLTGRFKREEKHLYTIRVPFDKEIKR